MLEKDLIVFDLEASGKDPDTASIIQIGSWVMDKNLLGLHGGVNRYITPYTDVWEDEAEAVHKVSKGTLMQYGENILSGIRFFENELTLPFKSYHLATWGNGYDIQLLRNAYKRCKLEFPFSHKVFDISSFVVLYLRAIGMIGKDRHGLSRCAKALGIDTYMYSLHDAYQDAALTCIVLRKTLNLIRDQRMAVRTLKTIMNVDKI